MLCLFSTNLYAQARELSGHWYHSASTPSPAGPAIPPLSELHKSDSISLTGGEYWFIGEINITHAGRYVIDFKNTTTIGLFHHYIYNPQQALISELTGGIQSEIDNPFFLRHGREIELQAGNYRIVSKMSSPFYLAQPALFIAEIDQYRSDIKGGNALVLASLGIFLGLGFYYAVLSFYRKRWAESMYALFILGNLLYNGSSLLILPDLFGFHWFYMISAPILFSNGAYILFVMALLHIKADTHPRLYKTGNIILIVLSTFILLAYTFPNWSLELARLGVAIFLIYGLISGIARARESNTTAKLYLVALTTFFVLGGSSISKTELPGIYTYHIEHLGLLAVTIEIILLAFVLSYQFRQLQQDKDILTHDIESEKKRHRELAEAKAEADRANQAKSEFLSNMSHELRTPMNSILGYSEILLEEKHLPPQSQKDIQKIHKAGRHLLNLINDVLDISQIESGKLHLKMEKINLNDILSECIEIVTPLGKKLDVDLVFDKQPSYTVSADYTRLKQVIYNLLSNAIKYNRKHGKVFIDIKKNEQNTIQVNIKDTGYGIPQEKLPQLFEPFNRLGINTSEVEGSGIGLTLVRSFVEQMDAQLGIESTVGEGSCFYIQLPIADSNDNIIKPIQSESESIPDTRHTVLYIDDDKDNLSFIERITNNQSHMTLITTDSAEDGLKLALKHLPSIIMLDIKMPELDGKKVLAILKDQPELLHCKFFAITAYADEYSMQKSLQAGFSEYLTKPIDITSFIALLNRYFSLVEEQNQILT
ncbi:MAG: response regulator [Gammaproteobacteria bacterium]|nr:response regulator [Gammaproteobacteria bacterium]